jgi:hypothetical protein
MSQNGGKLSSQSVPSGGLRPLREVRSRIYSETTGAAGRYAKFFGQIENDNTRGAGIDADICCHTSRLKTAALPSMFRLCGY